MAVASEAVKVTRRSIDLILLGQFRSAWLYLGDLPKGVRALALLGYATMGIWLIVAVVLQAFSRQLPVLEFQAGDGARQVPILVLIVAGASFALGWAYVMTAATQCRLRVLVPVAAIFLFQLFLLFGLSLPSPGACVVFPMLLVALGVFVVQARKGAWRDRSLLAFGVWTVLLVAFMVGIWFVPDVSKIAKALDANLAMLMLMAIGYWAVSGLGVVDFGVSVSGILVGELRRVATRRALYTLLIVLLIVRPVVPFIMQPVLDPWWVVDFFICGPIWVWAIVLTVRRRWNARMAALVIGTSLASTVIVVGLGLVQSGHDFGEVVLSAGGLVPPILLFIGLTVINLLGVGAGYIRTDGKSVPRTARVLLLFGIIALVFSFMLFNSLSTNQAFFVNFVQSCAFLGVGFLGPIYLIRILMKNSGRLLGEEFDEVPATGEATAAPTGEVAPLQAGDQIPPLTFDEAPAASDPTSPPTPPLQAEGSE
jgi:hypothetical protein